MVACSKAVTSGIADPTDATESYSLQIRTFELASYVSTTNVNESKCALGVAATFNRARTKLAHVLPTDK